MPNTNVFTGMDGSITVAVDDAESPEGQAATRLPRGDLGPPDVDPDRERHVSRPARRCAAPAWATGRRARAAGTST